MPTCDCNDEARRGLVQQLSHDAVVIAAQVLFEKAVATTDSKLLRNSLEMLRIALGFKEVGFGVDAIRVYCEDDDRTPMLLQPPAPYQPPKVYVSKGSPCEPDDCELCLWKPLCEQESTFSVIRRNREAVAAAETAFRDAEKREMRQRERERDPA